MLSSQSFVGTLITERLESIVLRDNRIELDTKRKVNVYLPPSYENSLKAYPTVYYLHSAYSNPDNVFEDNGIIGLMERGLANTIVDEFILVVADFSSPTVGSLYENSTTSGRWQDFITEELVPWVDRNYRTLKHENGRALIGHFIGGRGALVIAMLHPELFGNVYAMHPVATGSGYLPRNYLGVNWEKVHSAKSFQDLNGTGRTQFFVAVCQAFLPNPERPPFYCDFLFEPKDGELAYHPDNARREQKAFHLDEYLDKKAENLRSLNAIAFDWARFDETQAHVISNRRFSKKLEELGIFHEGEEFTGGPFDSYWSENGRFYSRVLPFLAKNLMFGKSE